MAVENEIEEAVFAARLACIQEAVEKSFDLSSAAIPGWVRLGAAKLQAGEQITPQVLRQIDRSETTQLAE